MVVNPGEQTMTLIKRIFANGWQSIGSAIASFTALIAPAVPAALTAFSFITIDMYYGYKVSRKYGRKEFESSKFWKTINKFTEAAAIIFLGLLLDKYIFMSYEELSCVRVAAGAVCCAETLSLLESLRALHPNAWLSKILSKVVKSKADKYLDVDIDEIMKETKEIPNDNSDNK